MYNDNHDNGKRTMCLERETCVCCVDQAEPFSNRPKVQNIGISCAQNFSDDNTDFRAIKRRPYALRGKTKFFNVYVSMEDKGDSVKDKFYRSFELVFNSLFSNDLKIVLDDFNAKIRKRAGPLD